MILGYDYPILGIFWTLLLLFLWVAWIVLVIRVFVDVFANHETSGWSKAFWSLFVIVIPWLGVLAYLIVHGDGMARRSMDRAQAQQAAADDYIRNVAAGSGGASAAEELSKLAALKEQGVLTDAEFQVQTARLLGS